MVGQGRPRPNIEMPIIRPASAGTTRTMGVILEPRYSIWNSRAKICNKQNNAVKRDVSEGSAAGAEALLSYAKETKLPCGTGMAKTNGRAPNRRPMRVLGASAAMHSILAIEKKRQTLISMWFWPRKGGPKWNRILRIYQYKWCKIPPT